jgi:hypothetical protein
MNPAGRGFRKVQKLLAARVNRMYNKTHEIELGLAKENVEGYREARGHLREAKKTYEKNRYKKWMVALLGVFIGAILGLALPGLYKILSNSLYDRKAIEGLMETLIGSKNISSAMPDELLIVAYDYNSKTPRFYSKHFAELDAGIYDVKMSKATGGSSAAPIFFEPQQLMDQYGVGQLVIDGGIIGNNPSLFAYLMQTKIQKK